MTAIRVRRSGENSSAVVSPRFFAVPPRSTSSTTYCGVLPSNSRARKMFSRDAPRQSEKRFRFLVGQCQPIFPTTTIFLSSFLLESSNQCMRNASFHYVCLFLHVDLYYSAARMCRANEKEIALSMSVYEKSSSHDRRTSENSILSGLAKSRLA